MTEDVWSKYERSRTIDYMDQSTQHLYKTICRDRDEALRAFEMFSIYSHYRLHAVDWSIEKFDVHYLGKGTDSEDIITLVKHLKDIKNLLEAAF